MQEVSLLSQQVLAAMKVQEGQGGGGADEDECEDEGD